MSELSKVNLINSIMKFDPVDGSPRPYPSQAHQYRMYHENVAWMRNPWTGEARDPRDIGPDPLGWLIQPPLKQEARITISGPVQCGKFAIMAYIQHAIEAKFDCATVSASLEHKRRLSDPDNPTKEARDAIAQTLWILDEADADE